MSVIESGERIRIQRVSISGHRPGLPVTLHIWCNETQNGTARKREVNHNLHALSKKRAKNRTNIAVVV